MLRFSFFVLAVLILGFATASATLAQDDDPSVVFRDAFDRALAPGWSWVRENPAKWCVRDGALEIGIAPVAGGSAQNVLRREMPDRTDGTLAVEMTLTSLAEPTKQYEQTGLYLMQGDRLIFKFVKERIDDVVYVFPGKKPMDAPTVRMRLLLSGNKVTAQYQPNGEGEFLTAVEADLPPRVEGETIGPQTWHGPEDADHWIRFDDFVIRRVEE